MIVPLCGSRTVVQSLDIRQPGAIRAAKDLALAFDTVTNDAASAVAADWSELVNGALEAVERVGLAPHHYLKGLVVLVPAGFTPSHCTPPDFAKAIVYD